MNITSNGLKKPLVTEKYDINIFNDNTDVVDNFITNTNQQISQKADKTYISTNYGGKYIKLFEMAKGDTNFYYGELYQTTNYGVLSSLEVMFESRNHKAIVLSKGDYDNYKAVVKIYDDTTNNKYYGYLQAGSYNVYAGVKVNAQKGCDVTNTVVTAPTGTLIYDSTSNSYTLDDRTTVITDANLAVKNGKYAITSGSGLHVPITGQTFIIEVSQRSDTYLIQRAKCYSLAPYNTYERICSNGTWKNWEYMPTETYIEQNCMRKRNSSLSIYVATTGSDTTGNGSSTNPYATIQKALDSLEQFADTTNNITIYLANGSYAGFNINNRKSYKYLIITGNTSDKSLVTITSGVKIVNSNTLKFTYITFGSYIDALSCGLITDYCEFTASTSNKGLIARDGTYASILRTNITGRTYGITAYSNSYVSYWNGTISNCTHAVNTGSSSGSSGLVTLSSATLSNNTSNYDMNYGGVIFNEGLPVKMQENGTWTPSITGSTTTGTITDVGTQIATYTRVGKIVTATLWKQATFSGFGGYLQVTGLPIVPKNVIQSGFSSLFRINDIKQSPLVLANSTTISKFNIYKNSGELLTSTDINGKKLLLQISITYEIA